MKKSFGVLAALAVLAVLIVNTPGGATEPAFDLVDAGVHLALESSAPEQDEVLVASPSDVTLWFTQAPQMAGTSVRLLPKGGEPLDIGDAAATEDDPTVVVLDVADTLAEGEYQVMWRAMAQDGHTIRGEFGFMVQAQR